MPRPKIVKFGKSSGALLGIKRDFFVKNDEFLELQQKLAKIYVAQPRRTSCRAQRCAVEASSFDHLSGGAQWRARRVLCAASTVFCSGPLARARVGSRGCAAAGRDAQP